MSSNNISGRNKQDSTELKDNTYLDWPEESIFIIVSTYPVFSKKYKETVCTAGITSKGKLIRIYPIPYRYLNGNKQYHKYQWIKAKIKPASIDGSDKREESYKINPETIQMTTAIIPTTKGGWQRRRDIIEPLLSKSLCDIKTQGVSLGIFKPESIIDFVAEPTQRNMQEYQEEAIKQINIFQPNLKPLEKLEFQFSYIFKCSNPDCPTHKLSILDWEIFALYRNLKNKYGYAEDVILEKIRQKYLLTIAHSSRDVFLIVGTHHRFKTFMIIGIFWPPILNNGQKSLGI